jgi:hypothetical protein
MLAGVFRFAVLVACAYRRAALTAASALPSSVAPLSSAGVLALDGARG